MTTRAPTVLTRAPTVLKTMLYKSINPNFRIYNILISGLQAYCEILDERYASQYVTYKLEGKSYCL